MIEIRSGETSYFCVGPKHSIARATKAFTAAVEYDWKSSGLDEDNSFTTVLVLRAAGLLRKHGVLNRAQIKSLQHKGIALETFAKRIAGRMPESFRVADYPPKPAIAYWFVDALEHLGARVSAKRWERLADWASREFAAQLCYVTAKHDALLDPVAMIMAACLVERMRKMAKRGDLTKEVECALIPGVELRYGIEELFRCQSDTGIWPKYFPLFHYKDAGANYCFHFEFLEAMLNEFGDSDNKVFELPPGTSKTTFARAVATQLGWPYIEINPSHFLSNGLEQIYVRTDEIFRDLMDLSGVVVLFDEMDALVES